MELQNNQHQRFGARLTLEEQAAFMGVSRTEVSMISPDLLTHLKGHVKEQAELAKNLRLAREERENTNMNVHTGNTDDKQMGDNHDTAKQDILNEEN